VTDTQITPELVDAVADWWESRGAHAGVQRLRTEASHLRREQAEEKRIDEYARTLVAAMRHRDSNLTSWDQCDNDEKEDWRAGIRAVLAKLDEEQEAEARAAFGDEQCTTVKFDKGGHTVTPVRQWLTLTEVPDHVQTVTDKNRARAHRDKSALHGWRWDDGSPISQWGSRAFAPYTEVTS
jgi:hypothetical protein